MGGRGSGETREASTRVSALATREHPGGQGLGPLGHAPSHPFANPIRRGPLRASTGLFISATHCWHRTEAQL